MSLDVTVVVATYGGAHWAEMAKTAVASAERTGVPVVNYHGESLHEARNTGLSRVETELVCFLDGDDELHPNFFIEMAESSADVRAPAVQYVRGRHPQRPVMPKVAGHQHACTADCLPFGNWLVIGSVAPTKMIKDVGGFRDFDWSEDWDLWVRCMQAGATFEAVPRAIYIAHVHVKSRNRGAKTREQKLEAHRAIARANGLPVP